VIVRGSLDKDRPYDVLMTLAMDLLAGASEGWV